MIWYPVECRTRTYLLLRRSANIHPCFTSTPLTNFLPFPRQTLLMFAAIFSVIAVGCVKFGGPAQIWAIAEEGKRIEFFK